MIETYKILNNIDKVQYEQILPLSQTTTFHLPVGRYLVKILYPDFSNDCSIGS
jgi:hypothetical protein